MGTGRERERERDRHSMFGIMVVESQGYKKHFKAKSVSLSGQSNNGVPSGQKYPAVINLEYAIAFLNETKPDQEQINKLNEFLNRSISFIS